MTGMPPPVHAGEGSGAWSGSSAPSAPSPEFPAGTTVVFPLWADDDGAPSAGSPPSGEMGADLAALLPGLRVVAGNPDEAELAAVVALGVAAAEALAAEASSDDEGDPAAEWRRRARAPRAAGRIAGTSSDDWRWSLHP